MTAIETVEALDEMRAVAIASARGFDFHAFVQGCKNDYLRMARLVREADERAGLVTVEAGIVEAAKFLAATMQDASIAHEREQALDDLCAELRSAPLAMIDR